MTTLNKYIDFKTKQSQNYLMAPFGHLGISRSDMPQIPSDRRDEFIKFMEAHGVTVKNRTVRINTLKMCQGEYNREKVHSIIKNGIKNEEPIFIDSHGYVLDGNHRMLAKLNSGSITIKVTQLGMKIQELIPLIDKFPKLIKKSIHESVV